MFLAVLSHAYNEEQLEDGSSRVVLSIPPFLDIEGGIGTLFAYASLRRQLGDQRWCVDGEAARLSASAGGSTL